VMEELEPLLMIPGPTDLPDKVREALARPMINHRGAEFADVLGRCTEGLRQVFVTEQDVLTLTSSGTGGMEAAVANTLSPGDRVLALSAGNFGERMAKIARAFGAEVQQLDFEWGAAIDVGAVQRALRAADKPFRAVLWTHNETSTAITHDTPELCRLAQEHGALSVVDCISGMAGSEFHTDEWSVDVVIAGSQKGLMLPPGLAFISLSDRAWEATAGATMPRFYFDLVAARESLAKGQTPYTPAVSLFFALEAALEIVLAEGMEAVWRRHRLMGEAVRRGVRALGLELFGDVSHASAVVTAVRMPEGLDAKELLTRCAEREQVTIARGQGKLGGKIFRLAHLGMVNEARVLRMLEATARTLDRMGYSCNPPEALEAARTAWVEDDEVVS